MYSKVQFDPVGLTISPSDHTYASQNGMTYSFGSSTYSYVDYGSAADCAGDNSQTGVANINLSGTGLAVAANQFNPDGYNAAGTAVYSANNQIVDLTGGGSCGQESTASGDGDNAQVEAPIQVQVIPCSTVVSTAA